MTRQSATIPAPAAPGWGSYRQWRALLDRMAPPRRALPVVGINGAPWFCAEKVEAHLGKRPLAAVGLLNRTTLRLGGYALRLLSPDGVAEALNSYTRARDNERGGHVLMGMVADRYEVAVAVSLFLPHLARVQPEPPAERGFPQAALLFSLIGEAALAHPDTLHFDRQADGRVCLAGRPGKPAA
jgi:hypothetical protein